MTSDAAISCLVCNGPLELRVAHGRKSNKPFLLLICPVDGRHFRGFIADREYVAGVIRNAESDL